MKPLKLTMSAFGPYKGKVEIDFEKMGKNGIFLVTGDTGAGKTTIFDAISFALFGEVSGSNRQVTSLRSDFAEISEDTYAELEFEHKGVIYQIKRNPQYERPKTRGEGFTKNIAEAVLKYDDTTITKSKAVDEKIEEILGINCKQFKQIAMLAQGEFLKILFAESKDRTDIFRKIFETDIYNIITRRLCEKQKEYKDNLGELKNTFVTNSSNIIWNEIPEVISRITSKDLNKLDIEEILDLLEKEINRNKEDYNKFTNEYEKLEKKCKKIDEKIKAQIEINNNFEKYEKLLLQKEELDNKKEYIEDKKKFVEKNQKILSIVLPKEEKVLELENELKKLNKDIEDLKKNIEKGEEKEKLNKSKEKKVLELKKQYAEYQKAEEKYNEINLQKIKLEQINKIVNEKNKLVIKYNKISEQYKDINIQYLNAEDLFFKEQAGILSEKLKDNEPCPVCGSLDHPHKAEKSDEVLSKEMLNKLKEERDEKFAENNDIKNKITGINSKYETMLNDIEDSSKSDFDLKSYSETLEKTISDILKKIKIIEDTCKGMYYEILNKNLNISAFDYDSFKSDFDKLVISDKEELLKNQTLIKELENQKNIKDKNLNSAFKEYENAYQKLGYVTAKDYKDSVLNEKEQKILIKEIENYNKCIIENKTIITELEKKIKEKEKKDVVEDKKRLEDEENNLKSNKKELLNLKGIVDNNKRMNTSLKNTSKELLEKMDEFVIYDELARTASGTLNGKRRIEFEQYVQSAYFDMIIQEANKRLVKMTDNRFLLVRKESSEKVYDRIGLDLEVIDNYNGKKRDVKSLSGGESFKAALSLALGLSDIIQSYSGGVVIDTLFIDEGFGSLDTESREQAINTLASLIDGNKLIGIISHVTELKDRIDKKIIVSKSANGSSIELV